MFILLLWLSATSTTVECYYLAELRQGSNYWRYREIAVIYCLLAHIYIYKSYQSVISLVCIRYSEGSALRLLILVLVAF